MGWAQPTLRLSTALTSRVSNWRGIIFPRIEANQLDLFGRPEKVNVCDRLLDGSTVIFGRLPIRHSLELTIRAEKIFNSHVAPDRTPLLNIDNPPAGDCNSGDNGCCNHLVHDRVLSRSPLPIVDHQIQLS